MLESGWIAVAMGYTNLCDCMGHSMSHCGINIADGTNGWNVLYNNMVQYYCSQFPKGGDTIITQEVLEHICNDIISSTLDVPQHSLGTNLPHFSQLCCENSTTFDTKLPPAFFGYLS